VFKPSQCLHEVAVVVLHGDVAVYSSPVIVYRDCSPHSTTHNVKFVSLSAAELFISMTDSTYLVIYMIKGLTAVIYEELVKSSKVASFSFFVSSVLTHLPLEFLNFIYR